MGQGLGHQLDAKSTALLFVEGFGVFLELDIGQRIDTRTRLADLVCRIRDDDGTCRQGGLPVVEARRKDGLRSVEARRLLVCDARAFEGQELGIDPALEEQLRGGNARDIAHFEAELARGPGEHPEDAALDVLAQQGLAVVGAGRLPGRQGFEQLIGRWRPRADVGGADPPLIEEDPALSVARAQQQLSGLPGEADDLQDVPEAEVLETADQAHALPTLLPPRWMKTSSGRPLLPEAIPSKEPSADPYAT